MVDKADRSPETIRDAIAQERPGAERIYKILAYRDVVYGIGRRAGSEILKRAREQADARTGQLTLPTLG